ncbi:MAG TPA: hypothetical protein DEO70_02875 [Bacteroidales bacterium]|nr:MAG: hypothetical protein A2X11_14275 [Bacteroidetes bacterium GWE2_42_24]OFY30022.1 MAG: hypothetical protein A2X09_14425 [Bacteroidetes bacterium GWF2_43_11]HBZ65753.1 hypothetical protein [Bacteroidales bacterium]
MNLDEICYKNTPIKRVIIKIDFLGRVAELNDNLPLPIADVIKQSFPIAEAKDVVARELQISNEKVTENNKNVREWHFHTEERNATLIIEEDFFAIQINHYISFEKIMLVLKEIKDIFFTQYPKLLSRRLGIRFINEINLNEKNPFDWKKYINPKLTSIFEATQNPSNIIRAFHNLEVKYDDILLKFQYGMHNQDYPATIKKKTFILDLDASFSGILKQHEIDIYLLKQHSIIQKQFEYSITDKLRSYFGLKLPNND